MKTRSNSIPGKSASNRKNQPQQSEQSEQSDKEQSNTDLNELFVDELADVASAEKQLTKALPKLAKAAQSEELREAFESHLEETRGHITRLEQVAKSIGESLKNKTCKAMKGLVEEGEEIMEENEDSSALDAGLIAAAQKVEHYEIASYGTLIAWARQLGHEEAVGLLEETLTEEKAADDKLTEIAEAANSQG